MNITDYDLVIFDADGTLIDRELGVYLFDVEALFERLHNKGIYTAIATNQGGPACHDVWGDKFPDLLFTMDRFSKIEQELKTMCLVALAYQNDKHKGWYFPEGLVESDKRLSREWRKPRPGMLKEAMRYYNINPRRTLMVGDDEHGNDSGAAQNAGVSFLNIEEFKAALGIT